MTSTYLNNPRPLVSFSFDDGPHSDITVVKPILDAKGVKASFCLVTRLLNGLLLSGASGYDWAQARALRDEGHDIVAHSANHISLSGVSAATLQLEVNDCYTEFVANGLYPRGFCWPGSASDTAARTAAAKSYNWALGDSLGGTSPNVAPLATYKLRRPVISNIYTLATYTHYVDLAVAANGWIPFISHSGYDLDVTQQGYLSQLIDYIRLAGVEIVTVGEALDDACLIYPDTIIYPWTVIYPSGLCPPLLPGGGGVGHEPDRDFLQRYKPGYQSTLRKA